MPVTYFCLITLVIVIYRVLVSRGKVNRRHAIMTYVIILGGSTGGAR